MIRGLFSAAAGMTARMQEQDAIANNLANVNTSGYKRQVVTFSAVQSAVTAEAAKKAAVAPILPEGTASLDKSTGQMRQTGVMTDFALDGEGYFVIEGKDGERTTRSGSFHADASGVLVDTNGEPVLGESGRIQVGKDQWAIDSDGSVHAGGAVVGKLKIAEDGGTRPRIVSGSLEGSNVNTVKEMVSMITAMRSYESCQKTIQSIDETLDRAINQMNK